MANVDFQETVVDDLPVEEEKAVRLSLHLIVKRHLPKEAEKWDQEKMLNALNKITHLRLDRERIKEIDSLELLGDSVTNVYLQQNRIERIQNLECLKNLSFLTLAGNRISVLQNLTCLNRLVFLDLSENKIETVHIEELPQSLIILNLKDNPCTQQPDHRSRLVQSMPHLKQLDLVEISHKERREVGQEVSSSSEEEEEAEEDTVSIPKGNVQSIASNLLMKSQQRLEEGLRRHKKHMSELDDVRLTADIPATARTRASGTYSASFT